MLGYITFDISFILFNLNAVECDELVICFCGMVDRRKAFSLIMAARTIVRDRHHRKYLTRRKKDLNLRRT